MSSLKVHLKFLEQLPQPMHHHTGFVSIQNHSVSMLFSFRLSSTRLNALYVSPLLWGLPFTNNTFKYYFLLSCLICSKDFSISLTVSLISLLSFVSLCDIKSFHSSSASSMLSLFILSFRIASAVFL